MELPAPTIGIANIDTNPSDYTISGPTVIDNITGLQWQRVDDDTTRNWVEAGDYCATLTLGGFEDWRLPSFRELHSIIDFGNSNLIIEQTTFPDTNSDVYWTATRAAGDSNFGANTIWIISFLNGFNGGQPQNNSHFVRCVRH